MLNNYKFSVQEAKKLRIIIDTDAACEADDQFAIVHALLTPRFYVKGIIAELFKAEEGDCSVDRSYAEIEKLLGLMEITDIPTFHGAYLPLKTEDEAPVSDGADFIISEALKDDDKPLYVLCQGALTNVAAALNKCPEIAGKFVCVWIGGGFYPSGGWEFNLFNDINAANAVFKSNVELWQVPMDCYTQMQIGYAELQTKVMPRGKVGQYLFDEMTGLGMNAGWVMGESWSLGDTPALGIVLNNGCGRYETRRAPVFDSDGRYHSSETNREIRIYHEIDTRYLLEDFFAKLLINYEK